MKVSFLLPAALLVLDCSAPRSVMHSGKVTPKGHIKAGGNMSYNVPTATLDAMFGSLEKGVQTLVSSDTIVFDSTFNPQIEALAIFSVDPVAVSTDFYARCGVIDRVDIGFALASGARVIDARFQVLGSTGTLKEPSEDKFYASLGIQYSWQDFELPSYLGDLQSALKYKLKRKDILIPLAFSNSFGPEETYGALSYGLVYGRSWLTYEYAPNIVYELVASEVQEINDVPRGKNSFNTWGCFGNVKLGYKFVYGLLGLAVYYQDYGTYNLYKDETASFSGVTLVPSWGLQLAF
jgi:hypothetical protein